MISRIVKRNYFVIHRGYNKAIRSARIIYNSNYIFVCIQI